MANNKYYDIHIAQKDCGGRMIGEYTHQHNCVNRGGKCCSKNKDGTNGYRAGKSQSYCGYCFN